ncbi:hypothetical protein H4R33_006180 [Dimargaris cristalligena]|nr:hypothetical protein H4R33_006180 [Dimargaris cristalligena]
MQFTSFIKALPIAIIAFIAVAQANPANSHSDNSVSSPGSSTLVRRSATHTQELFRRQPRKGGRKGGRSAKGGAGGPTAGGPPAGDAPV